MVLIPKITYNCQDLHTTSHNIQPLTISTGNRIILPSYRGGVILDDELLSVERVAKILDVHPDTVRRYVRQKKLKAVRLSSTNLRIRRSELDRFIKEREID